MLKNSGRTTGIRKNVGVRQRIENVQSGEVLPSHFWFVTHSSVCFWADLSKQAGAITLIQRFGRALNLNIYLHLLVLVGSDLEPLLLSAFGLLQ